jgi:hypothetical protein
MEMFQRNVRDMSRLDAPEMCPNVRRMSHRDVQEMSNRDARVMRRHAPEMLQQEARKMQRRDAAEMFLRDVPEMHLNVREIFERRITRQSMRMFWRRPKQPTSTRPVAGPRLLRVARVC